MWNTARGIKYFTTTVGVVNASTSPLEPTPCGDTHSWYIFDPALGWAGPIGWMVACGSRLCINNGYVGGSVQEIWGADLSSIAVVGCF